MRDSTWGQKGHEQAFRTVDLHLASFLATTRDLRSCARLENGRVEFVFAADDQLQEDVDAFFALRGSVAPLRYAQMLRALKRLVHDHTSTSFQDDNGSFSGPLDPQIKERSHGRQESRVSTRTRR